MTPPSRTSARRTRTWAEREESDRKYDPLYDWSLYGREDHPAWQRYLREKAMRKEAQEKGLIPDGTLGFDGVDHYGPEDPFLFSSYRPEEYAEFYARFPEVYQFQFPEPGGGRRPSRG